MKDQKNLTIQYYGDSDLGLVRNENQDSYGKFPLDSNDLNRNKGLLYIVADGMGGHVGGKEASQTAIKIVNREYFSFSSKIVSDCLRYAFKNANIKIFQSSKGEMQFHKKGTTCTALVLEQEFAHIAHVGDSRVYRIADGDIEQLTDDHTQVEEMLKKGIISEEEAKEHPAKSVLVRALGIESDIEVDIKENIPLKCGQYFVLCSDGLARVKKEEIKNIVTSEIPSNACKKLIQLANDRGGHDNITVLIIKICEDGNKSGYSGKRKEKSFSKKWFKFGIVSIALLLIILLGLVYFKDINNLFGTKTILEDKPAEGKDVDFRNENSEILLIKANYWYEVGQYDSSIIAYNLLLAKNPMHIGAINGIKMISNEYINHGKVLIEQKNYENALTYFIKADELTANNQNLQKLILFCEQELEAVNIENQSPTDFHSRDENNLEEKINKISSGENAENYPEESNSLKIDLSEWNFNDLTDSDYSLYEGGFVFSNTNKDKKAIYHNALEDVDFEVEIKFRANRLEDRAGIIIGYNEDQLRKEAYFLFIVERTGKFILRKVSDNTSEELLLVTKPIDANNKFTLKTKCLGPWIMIYNNDKLLDSWLSKAFIKGRIGLYAGRQTSAEFSNLKISSAFEDKTKIKAN